MSRNSSNTDIPKKSIIKKASISNGCSGSPQNEARRTKTARFDEDNIKETYRPADKDYGFEEITESKTPFERQVAPIDPNKLRERLMDFTHESDDDDDDEEIGAKSNNDSSDSKRNSAASGTSSTSAASKKSVISASLSITSGSSLSFEERRKKHIQAEFVLAKQASIPDVGDQDVCTKPECRECRN